MCVRYLETKISNILISMCVCMSMYEYLHICERPCMCVVVCVESLLEPNII